MKFCDFFFFLFFDRFHRPRTQLLYFENMRGEYCVVVNEYFDETQTDDATITIQQYSRKTF